MTNQVHTDKTFEKILDKLVEKKQHVRISVGKEDNLFGRVIDKDRDRIYLLPYLVLEPVLEFNRARLEERYYKPLLKMGINIEPISEGYIDDLIVSFNYINARKIKDKNLRKRFFNPEIYPMPNEETAEIFEKELRYNESTGEFKKPNILIVSSMYDVKHFLNGHF